MSEIVDITHPDFNLSEMVKWRYTYEGGRRFIQRYLTKLSIRESDDDFSIRKDNAYNPAYAKAAVNDIKNAIYQRMTDIKRVGGPPSYQFAVENAVDLDLNDMNTFIGLNVIIEMLTMERVGVLTDMPQYLGETLLDKGTKHPYLSVYQSENIKSWTYKVEDNEKILSAVLLCERVNTVDDLGLTVASTERYRHMMLVPEGVQVNLYTDNYDPATKVHKYEIDKTFNLKLPRIPFTIFEIPNSLLIDVADYQIALMNLESSDIAFSKKANFPIYYEFYDPKGTQSYKKPIGPPTASDGTAKVQNTSKDNEVAVGLAKGRRFPIGTDAPGFAAPNPDTLRVSMEKGKQLRDDIYRIVNLTVSNMNSSAESKQQDQGSLESGLSFIGKVLQKGENDIAKHWAAFENAKPGKVTYPSEYSIETEEQRQARAEHFNEMADKLPSNSYRRTIAKQIARITLGHRITDEELKTIFTEIDQAATLTCDPDQIIADHLAGLVDDKTASVARGYPETAVEQARKDKAHNIKLTMEAQGGLQNASAARGAPAFGGVTGGQEKVKKQKRGTADKVIKEKK